jgi:hypothetical protein
MKTGLLGRRGHHASPLWPRRWRGISTVVETSSSRRGWFRADAVRTWPGALSQTPLWPGPLPCTAPPKLIMKDSTPSGLDQQIPLPMARKTLAEDVAVLAVTELGMLTTRFMVPVVVGTDLRTALITEHVPTNPARAESALGFAVATLVPQFAEAPVNEEIRPLVARLLRARGHLDRVDTTPQPPGLKPRDRVRPRESRARRVRSGCQRTWPVQPATPRHRRPSHHHPHPHPRRGTPLLPLVRCPGAHRRHPPMGRRRRRRPRPPHPLAPPRTSPRLRPSPLDLRTDGHSPTRRHRGPRPLPCGTRTRRGQPRLARRPPAEPLPARRTRPPHTPPRPHHRHHLHRPRRPRDVSITVPTTATVAVWNVHTYHATPHAESGQFPYPGHDDSHPRGATIFTRRGDYQSHGWLSTYNTIHN